MPSIHKIVNELNHVVAGIFSGAKTYGIAHPAVRDQELLPAIGEKYIGIDDTYPMQVYHKLNTLTSSLQPIRAYGDQRGAQVNLWGMAMIIFNNGKRTNLTSDGIVLLLQSNFPQSILSDYYLSVNLTFQGANLNDQQVFSQEYRTDKYRLFTNQNLIQVNYTLETVFKKGCFIKCPEDLQKCLN